MRKILPLILFALLLGSCKSSRIGATDNVEVRFLDDYIIQEDLKVAGTLVGGLSGIDYQGGKFYLVSDDPKSPRFYEAEIKFKNKKIDTVIISKVINIDKSDGELRDEHLDLEGISIDSAGVTFYLSSEGSINNGKDPAIFSVSAAGNFKESFNIPEYFEANSKKEPRNNGSFEGLATSYDKQGIWAAMELPLKKDGPKPKLIRTKSPVRITYFDKETKEPVKQFPYLLEPIAKIPWLYFAVNGVTDLVQYAPNKFLVLERGFASGHGSNGNTIRIFDVDSKLATNTLERNNLGITSYYPAKKELVYDFKWAKKFLTNEIIDNIEGICFGPTLPNGNKTLVLISDNNFNSLGKQYNQVILMELKLNSEESWYDSLY